jgi:MraZ protein
VFLGTHSPRLDDKGRLFLPAKYREELAAGLVLTKGQERCLYVFPEPEFGRITEALRIAPVTAKAVRDYSRVFFASAFDEIPDKQGRITIPPGLRDYAALQRDCVVIGANTRLEIWDATAWHTYLEQQEDAFSDASEEVLPGLPGGRLRPGAGARRGLHPRWAARSADVTSPAPGGQRTISASRGWGPGRAPDGRYRLTRHAAPRLRSEGVPWARQKPATGRS